MAQGHQLLAPAIDDAYSWGASNSPKAVDIDTSKQWALEASKPAYDDYRQANRSISYYNKGQIVGEMLDLKIRALTDDHKSLDDVMRGRQ